MRVLGTRRSSYEPSDGPPRRRVIAGLATVSAAFLAAGLVAGCAAPPPPPPKPIVTPVVLTLVGGADMNPDARGRASPLILRVYALKTPAPFDAADFFSLFDKDQATLGAEMAQREEVLLRPGETRKIEMTLAADVKAIGLLAAYRDLDRARWREQRTVEPGKAMNLTLDVGARQVRISTTP
ncbi:N/A [soil metagenome]